MEYHSNELMCLLFEYEWFNGEARARTIRDGTVSLATMAETTADGKINTDKKQLVQLVEDLK